MLEKSNAGRAILICERSFTTGQKNANFGACIQWNFECFLSWFLSFSRFCFSKKKEFI